MPVTHQITLPGPGPFSATIQRRSLAFIGNATVLIRYGGFTVLTDPNFVHRHEKVDLGNGLSAERLTDPAMDIRDLPPLDLVLLSHFHGDHFDQVAERELAKDLPIVTTPEAAEKLDERGFSNVYPVETWSTVSLSKGDARLEITAAPGRHGPPLVSFALPDVMGSVLDFRPDEGGRLRVYITGDTVFYDDLREIPGRFPGVDLALLHLGGTRVLGITVTMDARQGVELIEVIHPRLATPIHYDDYDVFKSSLADFQEAVEAAGLGPKVHYLSRGDTYTVDMG